jgi:hypothetical protein
MVALRPGAPEFSVGDFIWQEIKHMSDDPMKICSYSPYIIYMVERVAQVEFHKGVKHKSLRLNPRKNLRLPSPRADEAADLEQEIFEEGAP